MVASVVDPGLERESPTVEGWRANRYTNRPVLLPGFCLSSS